MLVPDSEPEVEVIASSCAPTPVPETPPPVDVAEDDSIAKAIKDLLNASQLNEAFLTPVSAKGPTTPTAPKKRLRRPPKPKNLWDIDSEDIDKEIEAIEAIEVRNAHKENEDAAALQDNYAEYTEYLAAKLGIIRHTLLVKKFAAIAKEICLLECSACKEGSICGQQMYMLLHSKFGYFISSLFDAGRTL